VEISGRHDLKLDVLATSPKQVIALAGRTIDVKTFQKKKLKNVKNVKNRDKNKKNVCKR